MNELQDLIDNNERWAEAIKQEDPDFFSKLARQQTPEYLWIGCSDAVSYTHLTLPTILLV